MGQRTSVNITYDFSERITSTHKQEILRSSGAALHQNAVSHYSIVFDLKDFINICNFTY